MQRCWQIPFSGFLSEAGAILHHFMAASANVPEGFPLGRTRKKKDAGLAGFRVKSTMIGSQSQGDVAL
jgi:hypothetical protein